MGLLLLGFMLRAAADFHALLLNARHEERQILFSQGVAFVVGAMLLVFLAVSFGVIGVAFATIATSALYLLLVNRAVRKSKA